MARMTATAMFLVLATVLAPNAGAGSNIWTDLFPHPQSKKGYKVTCWSSGCSHLAPPLVYRRAGLRYRTVASVFRSGKGYGLHIVVKVSVTDGRRHGIHAFLSLSGAAQSLSKRNPIGWGFGGGVRYAHRIPNILPGQTRSMRTSYPRGRVGSGVTRGYRFTLSASVSNVVHYTPYTSRSPKVAVVVLTVPLRGPPRIRLKLPTS